MFWNVFYELCRSNGTKPNPVVSKLGYSSAVCTKWKAGALPNAEALIKLSDYFAVSIDYLLGRTSIKETLTDAGERTDVENNLIIMYRSLNQEGQEKAIEYLSDLTDTGKYKKDDTDKLVRKA